MKKQIQEIDKKINAIYEKYADEYNALADKSEELFDRQEALDTEYKELRKKYEELDKKTGMNALIEEGGELKRKQLHTKKSLQVGDKIKILSIPQRDIDDKVKREKDGGLADEGDFYTADIIEEIIQQNPLVEIDEIDEFGNPWFSVDLKIQGEIQHHTLAVMDDNSWERL